MIIKGYKKYDRRRIFMANKLNQKTSIEELLIDEIEYNSNNDWDKLCDDCSSLIEEANMSEKDIDDIVEKVKHGII